MKNFSFILFLFFFSNLYSQDTLTRRDVQDSLTIEDAIKYAINNNYGITISRNSIEIGQINNNWANAGAYPTIGLTANKSIGSNNVVQKLNSGADITRNGSITQNLNAGLGGSWVVFNGFKTFATKRRLEELERIGQYEFRRTLNETVYNVITAYFNIVKLKEQLKATLEQIQLYQDRYQLADIKYSIGSGAKFEVLQAGVDLNEQKANQLNIQNQINIAKSNLFDLMGKTADTAYKVSDTIEIHPLPDRATIQNKIQTQNPDILLANSNLEVLFQTRKEINAERLPVVTLNANYNFVRSSNGAGLTLYNQSYGPVVALGVVVPIFNGGLVRRQLRVADINIKNQNLTIDQTRNTVNTALTNAFINYQNALNIVALEKTNLALAAENINIAAQRFKLLNITSIELRQVQISYYDAKTILYNALYQAKLAEAEVALLTADISNL